MSWTKNRRILVIDDNPSIHQDFRKILERDRSGSTSLDAKEAMLFGEAPPPTPDVGFDIDAAHQGNEGLEMIQQALEQGRPYTVAFVDIRMPPGWDGIETIERIWDVDPQVQLVICSAYSDYSAHEILRRVGVTDRLLLLKKPCDCAEILLIATALNEKWNLAFAAERIKTCLDTAAESGAQRELAATQ